MGGREQDQGEGHGLGSGRQALGAKIRTRDGEERHQETKKE